MRAHHSIRQSHSKARRTRCSCITRGATKEGLQEEVPAAYKHIDDVIAVVVGAGLSKPVAKLTPLGVMKG